MPSTEPERKWDYAVSVRRLIRDGVDVPLANLFVHMTRPPSPDAEGVARRRAQARRFYIAACIPWKPPPDSFDNAQLPIPFDNRGAMEVDFLCASVPLVIELDGAQHLRDAEAYRRDRRKDALLQPHGYFILRFLAEDVGRQLDYALDAIQEVLVQEQRLRT